MKTPRVAVPLKFSFRADADYNNLFASESCPQQGYFSIEDEEDPDSEDEEDYEEDEEMEDA